MSDIAHCLLFRPAVLRHPRGARIEVYRMECKRSVFISGLFSEFEGVRALVTNALRASGPDVRSQEVSHRGDGALLETLYSHIQGCLAVVAPIGVRSRACLIEGETLFRYALHVDENGDDADHPRVAIGLENLDMLTRATDRSVEVGPLSRRAVHALPHVATATGYTLLDFQVATGNDASLLYDIGRAPAAIRTKTGTLYVKAGVAAPDRWLGR